MNFIFFKKLIAHLIILSVLFSLVGCYMRLNHLRKKYQQVGWVKVDKEDHSDESVYQLLLEKMDYSRIVSEHVNRVGIPDYLFVQSAFGLKLAYHVYGEIKVYEFDSKPLHAGKLLSTNVVHNEKHPLFKLYNQTESIDQIASHRNTNAAKKINVQASLTVTAIPANAKIRILNIAPKYHKGISLKPGKYHIEVTKPGYVRHQQWLNLNEDRNLSVALKKANEMQPAISIPVIEQKNDNNNRIIAQQNQRRTALVIGNANYKYSPLKNPANDARDIAKSLKNLGFKVTLKVNANQEQMETAINQFGRKIGAGGVGLFYYAGHGVQVDGNNYLIPVGAKINRQKDVRYKAVNLGQVMDEMGYARNGLNIAIIDACRDNPLPRSFRSSARGLARVDSPEGTLIAFATSPGSTAADGDGRNGLYTKYLLKHMNTPGISVEQVLKRVSRSVKKTSSKKQTPWMESSFTGDFYFVPE